MSWQRYQFAFHDHGRGRQHGQHGGDGRRRFFHGRHHRGYGCLQFHGESRAEEFTRSGMLQWQFGGSDPLGPHIPADWEVNHGHQLLPDGNFVFFNNGAGSSGSAVLEFALELQALNATEVWSYASEAGSGTLGEGGSDWHRPRDDRRSTGAGHGPLRPCVSLAGLRGRQGASGCGASRATSFSRPPRSSLVTPKSRQAESDTSPLILFDIASPTSRAGSAGHTRGRATQLALQPGLFVGPLSPVPCSLFDSPFFRTLPRNPTSRAGSSPGPAWPHGVPLRQCLTRPIRSPPRPGRR